MSEPSKQAPASTPRVWDALRSIVGAAGPRRRRQFYATLLLMVVGAIAELVTIGATLPFLAVISDPSGATDLPAVDKILNLLGWEMGPDLLVPATMLLVTAAVTAGAVRLLLAWSSNAFVFSLGHDLSVKMFSRILRQPYLYHVQRNTSEVIAGVEKVQQALFSVLLPIMQAAVAGFLAIFIIGLLLMINPLLAMISAAAIGGLYIGLSLALQKPLHRNSEIIGQAHTMRVKQVQEGLGGIRDILIDRSHLIFENGFRDIDDRLRRAQMTNTFLVTAPRFVIESGAIVLIALLALYMSSQPGGLTQAIPILGGLAIGAQRLLPLLQTLYSAWSRTAGSRQILVDIADLLAGPEPRPIERGPAGHGFRSAIEFDRVTLVYPGSSRPALSDVSLDIRKGERIGLIGKTGSGKSTFLDLAMGLLEPSSGEIRIDGQLLDERTTASWQAQLAHVPQSIYLADTTILENIAFGSIAAEIDLDRVRLAAEAAQIAGFIDSLPHGYRTSVGERGVRLSGGQRQRIGIARALYKQASVLILDEATSALDDETEAAVIAALRRAAPDVTMILVAHRASTLAGCDRVINLERGRLLDRKTLDTKARSGAARPAAQSG